MYQKGITGIKHVVFFFNAYTCIIKIKHDSLYYNIICIKKVLQGLNMTLMHRLYGDQI